VHVARISLPTLTTSSQMNFQSSRQGGENRIKIQMIIDILYGRVMGYEYISTNVYVMDNQSQ
jgi:hypothetical protein